jgi:hypothetical protein
MIFTSVVLSVGLALMDVAYKQAVLVAASRQSEYAFYNADSAMECAQYADQVQGVFVYDFPGSMGNPALNVKCQGLDVTNYNASQSGGWRTTSFSIPCPGGGVNADVTVLKQQTTNKTNIYVNGYNDCSASPQRMERGLQARD